MVSLQKGRYAARAAETTQDREAAQRLRALAFRGDDGLDTDPLDAECLHVLVEDQRDGALVCCYRLLPLINGTEIDRSYSAQFYDLSALYAFSGPMVELGRFCIHPDRKDADILRVAWGAMTGFVDSRGIEMLFGCASFQGTRTEAYHDAFALLRDRHLAPDQWAPRRKAPYVFDFAQKVQQPPDLQSARASVPTLLRTYLLMGGWVSDHAVIDTQMDTLHVFTGLEIKAVPATRARLLRDMVD